MSYERNDDRRSFLTKNTTTSLKSTTFSSSSSSSSCTSPNKEMHKKEILKLNFAFQSWQCFNDEYALDGNDELQKTSFRTIMSIDKKIMTKKRIEQNAVQTQKGSAQNIRLFMFYHFSSFYIHSLIFFLCFMCYAQIVVMCHARIWVLLYYSRKLHFQVAYSLAAVWTQNTFGYATSYLVMKPLPRIFNLPKKEL